MIRFTFLGAAMSVASIASAQQTLNQPTPTEWVILLSAQSSIAFAPTTYTSADECLLVAAEMRKESTYDPICLPTRFSPDDVSSFAKHREATAVEEQQRLEATRQEIEQLRSSRPALEAERSEILADRNKLNQKPYADRVLEIDRMLRSMENSP